MNRVHLVERKSIIWKSCYVMLTYFRVQNKNILNFFFTVKIIINILLRKKKITHFEISSKYISAQVIGFG